MRISDWSSDVCSSDLGARGKAMSLSLYDVSIPVFIRALESMSKFLEKGRSFADEKDTPHNTLLDARLYEDMAPLTSQIQRASDAAKFTAARMGQLDAPKMEDNESSFDELQARIATTIAFLKMVPADSMDEIGRASCRERVCKYG